MCEISNESACAGRGEGERIAPEIPLKVDDGVAGHTGPHERQSGFPPGKSGIEETKTRNHHKHLYVL